MVVTEDRQGSFLEVFADPEVNGMPAELAEIDQALQKAGLAERVAEQMRGRWPKSASKGRKSLPAAMYLRLLVLKHCKQWSYRQLMLEVKWSIGYRRFIGLGGLKAPHYSAVAKVCTMISAEVVQEFNGLLVGLAVREKKAKGTKMRADTTVVETNIHHPTDSSLLGDGVRVLVRTMKKVQELTGKAGTAAVDRGRSCRRRLVEIARVSRGRAKDRQERLTAGYVKLMGIARDVVRRAERFVQEIDQGVKRAGSIMQMCRLEALRGELEGKAALVRRGLAQTRARILEGDTRWPGKVLSLFEPHTEAICKGKAGKKTEFGKLVKIQECETGLITDYAVYEKRPSDTELLLPSVQRHAEVFGRAPDLVAVDQGFYSGKNLRALEKIVKKACIRQTGKGGKARRKERWFREGQKWRNGSEGRISVLKRRYGLHRCLYPGMDGIGRWVGWGVLSQNLSLLARQSLKKASAK